MADITDIQLEIKAVKFALKSFARFSDEQQRKDHLRAQFDAVQNLDTYFGFSETKLQDALNKLQENENLLLAQQDSVSSNGTPAVVWYLSESIIKSLHKYGLRGSVYDLAGTKGGFHSNEEKISIFYENPQLLAVRVLFSQESQCGSFQSSLEGMVRRAFDKDADIVHTRVYAPVNKPMNPMAVLSSDYISAENPDTGDFSVFSRLSSPDDMIVDPAMQPILWENANLSCFGGGCKGKRCHLMSQTSYVQHADNLNNILIMSAENHERFDGYSPNIAIRWVGATDRTVAVKGEEVTFCDIAIECLNAEVYKCVGTSIKLGTVSNSEQLTYFTSVAMPNPTQFMQFLTFKYLETRGLQNSVDPEPVLAKMSRVRAEVKQMMEQRPDITIDLNLQLKNKRNLAALGVVDV